MPWTRGRREDEQIDAEGGAQEARSLFVAAADAVNAGRTDDGLALFSELRRRFAGAHDVTVRAWVANARVTQAVVLGNEGRLDAAIEQLDAAAEELGADVEPAVRAHAAAALFNKGLALAHAGRSEEALACFDDVAERFGADADPVIAGEVAGALANKVNLLAEERRVSDAAEAADELVARFGGEGADPALRGWVASSLATKAAVLILRDPVEAGAAVRELASRYAEAPELDVRSRVATAWDTHGQSLARLGRTDEATAAFDEVDRLFGDDREMAVWTANSLYNKAIVAREAGRLADAAATLELAARRFDGEDDLRLRRHVVRALFNKGIVLRDAGDPVGARAAFTEVVTRFREDPDDQIADWVARSYPELQSGDSPELDARWAAARRAIGGDQSGRAG